MNKLTYEKHQPKYIGQDMMEFLANAKFEDLPAEVVTRARLGIVSITVNYSDYQKILPVIDAAHVRVDDSEFAGDVRLTLALRYEEAEEFMKRLFDVCNGRADCRLAGDRFDYL